MIAWHLLSEFALQLRSINPNQEEIIWQNVEKLLRKACLCEIWGIFKVSDLDTPYKFTAKTNYHWHAVGKNQGEFCSILDKIWKVSFSIGEQYILHCESKSEFGKTAQDFLNLLASILDIRFQHMMIQTPTSDSNTIQLPINSQAISTDSTQTTEHSPQIHTPKVGELPQNIQNISTTQSYTTQNISTGQPHTSSLANGFPEIIGQCEKLHEIFQIIEKVAVSHLPIIIQGESGTGKELIAKAIHTHSNRKQFPFISENCAAIPETLLESELFGYTKGAFTGAGGNKPGLFEIADKGTLFLDEVGDMSLAMQKKLLRAVQNGEIRRVGGKAIQKIDVRIITATNKNLETAMKNGSFREDLYYRLNGIAIMLPPLRERGQDIWVLFQHFITENARQMNMSIPNIAPTVQEYLLKYHWPGNIRELQNEAKRILALLEGNEILPEHLSAGIVKLTKH